MKVLGTLALSCVFVVFTPHQGRPSEDGLVVQSRLLPASGGVALHWAVVGARQRLEQPACQSLLSEYSDASGRTLQENLEALGETGGTWLARILFADGSGRRRCSGEEAYAFTTTGSRVVYVCGRAFKALADSRPGEGPSHRHPRGAAHPGPGREPAELRGDHGSGPREVSIVTEVQARRRPSAAVSGSPRPA